MTAPTDVEFVDLTTTISEAWLDGINDAVNGYYGVLGGTYTAAAMRTALGGAPTASPTFTGTVTIPTPFTLGAISVTPTGTELNYVAGVTSAIQTQLNALADPAWVDYSATSTVVGWVSFTTKKIFTKTYGNLVHVMYQIAGTSNAATATFTLPSASSASLDAIHICRVSNNGAATVAALALLPQAQNTINFYSSSDTTAFTASGGKSVEGQFFYAI